MRAFNSNGEGPASEWVETKTLILTPQPPTLHCIEWSSDSLTLCWVNVSCENIIRYIVEMQTATGTFKKIYEGPKLKFTIIMLKADTAYHFRVCAVDETRKGSYSDPYTFFTCFRLVGEFNIKALSLIQYDQQILQHSQVLLSTTLSNLNMRPSCKYERKDVAEERFRYSLSLVPSTVNRIYIYSLMDSLYILWTKPAFNGDEIRRYNILLQDLNNFNSCTLNTGENIQEVLLLNLDYGATYNIQIQAVNDFGVGDFSEMVQVTTLHKISQPPELRVRTSGLTFLELTWYEEQEGVLSYRVELLEAYNFSKIYEGPGYKCALEMLTPLTEYAFRISAFCTAGRSVYSKPYYFRTAIEPMYNPIGYDEQIYTEGGHAFMWKRASNIDEIRAKKKKEEERVKRVPALNQEYSRLKIRYHPPSEKNGVDVGHLDFQTLFPKQFLNDAVIEFYIKYLYCERFTEVGREVTYIFSSFFFSRIFEVQCPAGLSGEEVKKKRHDTVKTWTRKMDIFSKDFLIIPINQSQHWLLAVVCFPGLVPEATNIDALLYFYHKNKNAASSFYGNSVRDDSSTYPKRKKRRSESPCICIFDSLVAYSKKALNVPVYPIVIREYLDSEWTLRKGSKRVFNEFTMPHYFVQCPQQPNQYDCGIFMLQFVETFFKEQIPYFREDLLQLRTDFPQETTTMRKRIEIQKLIFEQYETNFNIPVSIPFTIPLVPCESEWENS